MIKKLFPILLLFASTGIAAQDAKDQLNNTISNETCSCLEKTVSLSDSISATELEMGIGLCILQVIAQHDKELTDQGIDIRNEQALEKFSDKIGEKLARTCDHFLEILFKIMGDENSATSKEIRKKLNAQALNTLVMTGTLSKTDAERFQRLWLKHDTGENVFICLQDFDNVELLNNINSLLGKKLRITYEVIEVYAPTEKKMIKMNKVLNIELLE